MKGLLLINLGTPKAATPQAISEYLKEFLLDPRVLDINPIKRHFLVRFIIAPKRSKVLTKTYESIWTDKGSPLFKHMLEAKNALCQQMPNFHVEIAMRYQEPSLEQALDNLQKLPLEQLVILPLFPQYASATTGSILEKCFSLLSRWHTVPKLQVITDFCDHPAFISALKTSVDTIHPVEKLIVSFHSLPERQVGNYRAHCQRTFEALTKACPQFPATISFQSRFGKEPWIGPETIEVAKKLGQDGVKNIAIIAPSFTMDCIETLVELEHEVKEAFLQAGGNTCTVIPCLNSDVDWIRLLLTAPAALD